MIVHPCLKCGNPELPIEQLRCPLCGEDNFIPLNRTLSAPESLPEPINETTGLCDGSTDQIGEAKDTQTGPNQNTDLKGEQQLQNCSNNPGVKNNALQDIPTAYDQAYSFIADNNDVCDSASANFSSTISTHGEEPQNQMDFSHQQPRKWQNQSSMEMATGSHYPDELSRFKNEDGEIDFAGCKRCHQRLVFGYFETFNIHQQRERDLKPHKCEKCLCRFSYPSGLCHHQQVHSEEKPFKCPYCDHASKRKPDLEKHINAKHHG